MAKRTNIERIIKAEIEKGNVYVIPGGNFVSSEMLEKEIKDDFKKEVAKEDFDVTMSFESFKNKKLEGMRKAEDLLTHINSFFETTDPTPDKPEKDVKSK